ncbi:hypothetical protein HPP92_025638 [Vanilla planifolia]|uniref:Cytochrome P450 n=1 Tax=Vanilla planifolia TaxID=51239 RepID=A0A835PGZ5_VANPL|nr:hypothetical protein HPP92_025638 [Vanilla planifolia]
MGRCSCSVEGRRKMMLIPSKMEKIMITVSLVALAFLFFHRRKAKAKTHVPYPPGPRGLPILGSLPFLEPNLHVYFASLARTYGPVIRLRLGSKPCVVVSSPSAASEMFKDQDVAFANHDVSAAIRHCFRGSKDVLWCSYGPEWRMLRKISATHVLNAGSIEAMAPVRFREVRRALRVVWERASAGEAIVIRDMLFQTAMNTTTTVLWGERVDDDGKGEQFQKMIEGILDHMIVPNVSDFFPFLAPLDPQGVARRVKGIFRWVDDYINDIVERRKKAIAAGSTNQLDMLQSVLHHMMHKNDPQFAFFTLADLRNLLSNIIGASTDSVTTTMEWAMTELLHNPCVMEKVQQELDAVVGRDLLVKESDIPRLCFLRAVMKETLRLHPPVPLLVPHRPSSDCTIGGFAVPSGTAVFVNAWAIQRDPSYWEDAEEFKPERFLKEGKELCEYIGGNNFSFLPFGAGRRACAGIAYAERMMMYSLASLLHAFEWRLPEGVKLELSDTFGFVLRKTQPLVALPVARLDKPELYA